MMRKILVVFGTRPEAIKMCPVIHALKSLGGCVKVCITGQHGDMLNEILDIFHIVPDYDLKIMKPNQSLFDITVNILQKIEIILKSELPDIVLVHGDTSTAFSSALACFYLKIPVGHVEAGLRTGEIYSPFPEEFNRSAVSLISQYDFAPTELAQRNLIKEGKKPEQIYVTGNTVIDTLNFTIKANYKHKELQWSAGSRLILMTAHRRENVGKPMENMFKGIRKILDEYPDVKIIYPIHPNPKVLTIANKIFQNCERIHLINPLDVVSFHNFMARSYFILTDSGGIQEEAPSLGKPVLIMRNSTERPEGLNTGILRLVGTDSESVYHGCKTLLDDKNKYARISQKTNLYGNGNASEKIAQILLT